jgi:formylglycine-generating enzyme required for sulfatase activity/uncharacterized protein YjbI with pentapeptide repeats
MSNKSHYEILQVRLDASPEVIKAAYKTLTAKYHPDRDSSKEAARAFAEIQRAFEVLSDPVRRRQYDMNPSASRTATAEPTAVLRTDGSSTFLTLAEHQRRGWQEAAGSDLSNGDFSGVSFKNAKLAGARLDGSRFIGCDFRGADLTDCSAKRCQFDKVDFAGAKLVKCDLSNCSIRDAKFFGISKRWESAYVDPSDRFTESDHLKTKVSRLADEEGGAILYNANFCQSDLTGTAFSKPHETVTESKQNTSSWGTPKETKLWTKQFFRSAAVIDCDFSEAALARCDCREVSLAGSKFESTNFHKADLRRCDVGGVDFRSVNLLDANLSEIVYSDNARFPNGFVVPIDAKNADVGRRAAKEKQEAYARSLAEKQRAVKEKKEAYARSLAEKQRAAKEKKEAYARSIAEEQRAVKEKKEAYARSLAEKQRAVKEKKEAYARSLAEKQRAEKQRAAKEKKEAYARSLAEKQRAVKEKQKAYARMFSEKRKPATALFNAAGPAIVKVALISSLVLFAVIIVRLNNGSQPVQLADSESGPEPRSSTKGLDREPKTERLQPFAGVPEESKAEQSRASGEPKKTHGQASGRIENSIGMELVLIEPGTFTMGSNEGKPSERPEHTVVISKPFYLAIHEVTQHQYSEVMSSNPSLFGGHPNNPVEQVSWHEATRFCEGLSSLSSEVVARRIYRLPTEAEWEYACRAGSKTLYSFGDSGALLQNYCWFDQNSGETQNVGLKSANPWGLYDMHGNVWEWCLDTDDRYPSARVIDPFNNTAGLRRILRGGSWGHPLSDCRSANRDKTDASNATKYIGFRVAMDLVVK